MIESQVSIDEAWKILLALGAGTGAVFMLRWFWWRLNAWSEITAMAASLVYFLGLQWLLVDSEGEPRLRSEELMLVVALATMATWLLVTFLTRAEAEETLVAFYRKVRPGGPGWRPIARLAPDVNPDRNLGWSIAAALAGSGIVFFTLPATGCLIFGQYSRGAALGVGAVICGCDRVVVAAAHFWLGARSPESPHRFRVALPAQGINLPANRAPTEPVVPTRGSGRPACACSSCPAPA